MEALFIGGSFRVNLAVGFGFLPPNFGKVVGTYECCLPFYGCSWGGGSICRWWGHLNPICCNRSCLNFLHLGVVLSAFVLHAPQAVIEPV